MRCRPIIFILPVFLAASCGVTRRATYNEPPAQVTPSAAVVRHPVSPPLSPTVDREQYPYSETPPATKQTTPEAPPAPVFAYSQTKQIGNPGTKENTVICLGGEWGDFCYPLQGKKISDYGIRSGRMHSGVDVKAQPLDTIRAIGDGVVRMSKEYYGYGNMVLISHANGLETLYGHNTRNLVEPNQCVCAGDPIALAGRTGRATTEHLHFEVRICGEYFNPNLLLDFDRRQLRDGKLHIVWRGGKPVVSQNGAEVLAADTRNESATASAGLSGGGVYTVIKGDTLYSISRRHGLTVDQLCRLNGIDPRTPIKIGQRLKVANSQ